MIGDTTIIQRNPRVESRGLGEEGGAVLLHLGSGAYHGTNDVGALIWELLVEEMTFAALLDRLRERLDEAPPTLAEEIGGFLEELRERDLVAYQEGDHSEPSG